MFIVLDLPHSACPYKAIILFMFDIDFIVLLDGIEPYRLLDHLYKQIAYYYKVLPLCSFFARPRTYTPLGKGHVDK